MLMRSDPFREFDRLTEKLWGGFPVMPMDAYRLDDQFVVQVDLPGVDPSTIDLTIDKNTLTVSAERPARPDNGAKVVAAERPHGRFSRQLFLDEGLDIDHIEAGYTTGVLTVHVPLIDDTKPRKVPIASGNGDRQVRELSKST
jgi:HSP20 family protein